ncbi:hypothetical protein [Burkholderia sp. Ac-20349]|uniref:hypothetical protein n=1 Tax=Burkholderia sp. Ac-20349 TaxID=2703893 RepID=UPI00197BBA6D|nr:hypothetical protein [Burkholderia sp. Ac-20349]MBN3839235.1 hypothetical protein [Burkholderia sp. Ac-20349]
MTDIEYFTYPGVEGRYFECVKLRASLSVDSCVTQFNGSQRGGGYLACAGCPIGASHANVEVKVTAIKRRTCARCLNPATRLVRDRICVSCYNRTLETKRGRNAKGGRPRKLAKVGRAAVMCVSRGRATVHVVDDVASGVEALVSVARLESTVLSFACSIPHPVCVIPERSV